MKYNLMKLKWNLKMQLYKKYQTKIIESVNYKNS